MVAEIRTFVFIRSMTYDLQAFITFKKKTYNLGSFSDIQDAVQARKKGEEMYEEFLDWFHSVNTGEEEE